jgi:hypothetical protein
MLGYFCSKYSIEITDALEPSGSSYVQQDLSKQKKYKNLADKFIKDEPLRNFTISSGQILVNTPVSAANKEKKGIFSNQNIY